MWVLLKTENNLKITTYKAKKINCMSQSLWKTGKPDLNAFFL